MARTIALLTIPASALAMLWSVLLIPGITMPAGAGVYPEPPSAEQKIIDQAAGTETGRQLAQNQYNASRVVTDQKIIDFLDGEQKKVGVTSPGTYVIFTQGGEQASKPNEVVRPDRVVDAASGVVVAVSQDYSNERGTICFNVQDPTLLDSNWGLIDAHLRGQSLDQTFTVDRKAVSELKPESFPATNCYLYSSS